MLIQKPLSFLLALITESTHCFTCFYTCWRPLWASTFFGTSSSNRPARSCIFEWQGHVGLCLYSKGQVKVLKAWQIWLRDPILHLTVPQLEFEKSCERIWHYAKVCQNGCHKHSSLWFLCDVTSTCRVFETSREQVTFILALEVAEIDHARVTPGAALCNTSFGQDKNGIRWTYDHSIVHGFRSPVRGVLPTPFPSHVPRIGIFCVTHKCWPVLLPAGSIRSSSPSGWYEDCFKPMALPVPGYPLRPSGSASEFSRPCRCPCWCKTGRTCISQGHS